MKTIVCKVHEVEIGNKLVVNIRGKAVVVFNVEERFYCIEDICSHDGGTVSDGEVDGCIIKCPRHGAKFDVRDGSAKSLPATKSITSYQVSVIDSNLVIDI